MKNSAISVSHKINEHQHANSLLGWCSAYLALVVSGSSPATHEAKKRDLGLFLRFCGNIGVGDRVQLWVPSLSKSFQAEMLSTYSAASVARTMATLKHFAKWLKERISLVAGDPMAGVQSIKLEEPSWNGLTKRELFQLKMAVDIGLSSCAQGSKSSSRSRSVLYAALYRPA